MKTIFQFKSIETFSTERLLAEKLQDSDLNTLITMDTNAEVMATLGGVRTPEQTAAGIQFNAQHWHQHGFGAWMIYTKTTHEWVGRCALRRLLIDGNEEIEIAYALMPQFWRQGLATEIANACTEIAFEVLHLDNVICFMLTTNTASQRVAEKAGFKYDRTIIYADLPHVLYRMKNPMQK